MKAFLSMAFILALASTTLADQVILIYAQGNTLFSQAPKTIRSNTMCSDPEVRRLLGKYDMSYGHQMSSGIVDLLDGYYLFSIGHGKGKEAADSLRAAQYVNTAAVNGSVHFLSGSRREPKDYWYNHTFKWAFGHHHYGCENPTYMPIPHYRQWHLPRGHYDRAWTVTVGDSSNVIAIIDSSFEIDHPDLMPLWAWNTSESADSIDTDANGTQAIPSAGISAITMWRAQNTESAILISDMISAGGRSCPAVPTLGLVSAIQAGAYATLLAPIAMKMK